MATPIATIIGLIQAKMQTIPGIGVVHDYERWSVDWPRFLAHYTVEIDGARQVRGWSLTRSATREQPVTNTQNDITHTIIAKGIHALKDEDASEKRFQSLIDAIADTFRPSTELAPGILLRDGARAPAPVQVRIVEPRMFGNILCHYAELVFTVSERARRSG